MLDRGNRSNRLALSPRGDVLPYSADEFECVVVVALDWDVDEARLVKTVGRSLPDKSFFWSGQVRDAFDERSVDTKPVAQQEFDRCSLL